MGLNHNAKNAVKLLQQNARTSRWHLCLNSLMISRLLYNTPCTLCNHWVTNASCTCIIRWATTGTPNAQEIGRLLSVCVTAQGHISEKSRKTGLSTNVTTAARTPKSA